MKKVLESVIGLIQDQRRFLEVDLSWVKRQFKEKEVSHGYYCHEVARIKGSMCALIALQEQLESKLALLDDANITNSNV